MKSNIKINVSGFKALDRAVDKILRQAKPRGIEYLAVSNLIASHADFRCKVAGLKPRR